MKSFISRLGVGNGCGGRRVGVGLLETCYIIDSLWQCFPILVFNIKTLSYMFRNFPSSNTPDRNELLLIDLSRILLITQSLESDVLEEVENLRVYSHCKVRLQV